MTRQTKSHVVDAGTKQKPCCLYWNKTIHLAQIIGFVKVVKSRFLKFVTWICQNCYMDLLKLLGKGQATKTDGFLENFKKWL